MHEFLNEAMSSVQKTPTTHISIASAVISAILNTSCTVAPTDKALENLHQAGYVEQAHFDHRVRFRQDGIDPEVLTVLIEGDGQPWIHSIHISSDPTPAYPLVLSLQERISGDSLYLGRPCYFGVADSHCDYRYWTSHRYSPEVVASMTNIVQRRLGVGHYRKLVLLGHSGGGTLASLMACSFEMPTLLLTLSANLDTRAWAEHHQWTPLDGSLDPARDTLPCPSITHRHFQGGEDQNTPAELNELYFQRHGIRPNVVGAANHTNWARFWPEIQRELARFRSAE
ncbi:hypothetical protein QVZ43_00535 [Marinobacter sp. chi1]|uniref:Alpha/beta hydrolase n=1 Tax=Marinobacter suaedae TaxID=3057675 RepID=A0ABT8VW11_9GAMM|nr:hypothetical protein [Marinobacter sp. chi1]MDO3720187.1 hypothetical protein [Marinobacter sp. chi1]